MKIFFFLEFAGIWLASVHCNLSVFSFFEIFFEGIDKFSSQFRPVFSFQSAAENIVSLLFSSFIFFHPGHATEMLALSVTHKNWRRIGPLATFNDWQQFVLLCFGSCTCNSDNIANDYTVIQFADRYWVPNGLMAPMTAAVRISRSLRHSILHATVFSKRWLLAKVVVRLMSASERIQVK